MSSTSAFPPSKSPRSDEPLTTGRLRGQVQPVASLTPDERAQMVALLATYFDDVTQPNFEADLAEKEAVILLADRERGQIRGFSTLMRLHSTIAGQPIVAFFSGDTIIDRAYWGETVLPRLWARHVFGEAALLHKARVYWFLISSGYKTYRFLPLFFREFYPTFERPTPPEIKHLLDSLALLKFPTGYEPVRGIVRLANAAPLRPDVANIEARRLRDPHIAFFAATNPGHAQGDELACLTEIVPTNLTAAGRRMLGK
ncbi:MAG: hypothetical protein H0T73_14235 [Ardenticatenales bacterium]|nr:hypothetical protein [Ardenticatenales bacterium]